MLLDILEERISCGEKVVIFTYHVFTLEYLNWILNNHGYRPALVYGNLSQEQREVNINAFQNIPECKVILGNYQTMGTGINLTASSTVVEYELPWTAVDETQAQDRCHRIGQFNPVSVIRLVTNNTTDEMNERIVDGKAELSENILDVRKMVGWALGLI
jgi:SNF2 family DNA or RNA helicase